MTGATDGGWPIGTDLTDYLLLANGTINWERLYAFAYQATYEMTIIGKSMTTAFYNVSSFYTYYDGCSEGGRGGQAQIQRFGDVYDGALIGKFHLSPRKPLSEALLTNSLGAPAMVHSFSQTFHIFPQVMEVEMDTYPSTCEFDAILTDTIDFCDGLDGLADGVISRSDLCFLNYNATHAVGNSFSCSETEQSGMVGSAQPAINGTVSLAAAELVNTIYAGVFDSKGRQVYISYQTGSELSDAVTTYDSATNTYSAVAGGIGVLFVNYFLNEVPTEAMSLENVTTDTIRDWMLDGYQKFSDSLQTNWPDLTDFSDHGGKVIHIHGESDDSVPTANSVYYHDSVRQVMYPDLGFNESYASLHDFYRLFLVPGAGHCAPGFVQTNSSWPSDAIYNLMAWVENGTEPDLLPSAQETGGTVELCLWPLRPLYTSNGTLSCVYDEQSIDTWLPDLNSIPMPVW